MILVMKDGHIVEHGSHQQMMENGGLYHRLVMRQTQEAGDGDTGEMVLESLTDHPEGACGNDAGNTEKEAGQQDETKEVADITADDVIMEMDQMEVEEEPENVAYWKVLKINLKEWPYITIGILASISMGAVMPVFAMLFGNVLEILVWEDHQKARDQSAIYAQMFVCLGFASGLAMFLQVCW